MAKLIKPLFGAANDEIYPRDYEVGEECPPELEDAAREIGALRKPSRADSETKGEGGE